jgi:hypothetical protein
MARGWESKAVEAQIETAERMRSQRDDGSRLTAGQMEAHVKREGLLLSRSRVLHDLEAAGNPRYRKMLEEALAHLESEIIKLR